MYRPAWNTLSGTAAKDFCPVTIHTRMRGQDAAAASHACRCEMMLILLQLLQVTRKCPLKFIARGSCRLRHSMSSEPTCIPGFPAGLQLPAEAADLRVHTSMYSLTRTYQHNQSKLYEPPGAADEPFRYGVVQPVRVHTRVLSVVCTRVHLGCEHVNACATTIRDYEYTNITYSYAPFMMHTTTTSSKAPFMTMTFQECVDGVACVQAGEAVNR